MSSGTEDVVGGGAELAESMMAVLGPAISALDKQVLLTRHSQTLLSNRIEEVSEVLHSLPSDAPCDIEVIVRKLEDSQRRVTAVAKTLDALTERLGKLQRELAKETYAAKQGVTGPVPVPPKR